MPQTNPIALENKMNDTSPLAKLLASMPFKTDDNGNVINAGPRLEVPLSVCQVLDRARRAFVSQTDPFYRSGPMCSVEGCPGRPGQPCGVVLKGPYAGTRFFCLQHQQAAVTGVFVNGPKTHPGCFGITPVFQWHAACDTDQVPLTLENESVGSHVFQKFHRYVALYFRRSTKHDRCARYHAHLKLVQENYQKAYIDPRSGAIKLLFRGLGDDLVVVDNLFHNFATFLSAMGTSLNRRMIWTGADYANNFLELSKLANWVLRVNVKACFTIYLRYPTDMGAPWDNVVRDMMLFEYPGRTYFFVLNWRHGHPDDVPIVVRVDKLLELVQRCRTSKEVPADNHSFANEIKFIHCLGQKLEKEIGWLSKRDANFDEENLQASISHQVFDARLSQIEHSQNQPHDSEDDSEDDVDLSQPSSMASLNSDSSSGEIKYLGVGKEYFSVRTLYSTEKAAQISIKWYPPGGRKQYCFICGAMKSEIIRHSKVVHGASNIDE